MRLGWLGLGFAAIVAACAGGADDGSSSGSHPTTNTLPNNTTGVDDAGTGTTGQPSPTTRDVGPVLDADGGSGTDAGFDAGPPPPPPPPPPPHQVTTESLTVWGKARAYVLVVPTSYDASRSYPLVLGLHGDGGTGAMLQSSLHLEDTTGQDAIVAYPSGTRNSWDLYTPVDQDEDVAYLQQLVEAMRARFNVGGAFAFGMSSGAFMANQMACRRPSLFRGIISHSGGAPNEPNASHGSWGGSFVRCNGQDSGVAAMVIHGTADSAVTYPSGTHDADYWATVNGCSAGYAASTPSPCQTRNGCPSGKPVVLCGIEGMGHVLWEQAAAATWSFVSGL